jgi:two-component system phosphate regulon sensor histidine kinase PhoR
LDGAAEDPDHGHRFLHQIDEQAERLHSLILDLLSLARIESGRETIDVRPVSAATAIAQCIEAHATVAESKQIVLCGEPIDEDLEVLADREEIQTLLGNLVENAINYTPSGGRVTVSCRRDGNWARIDVADTGIGIPRELQVRIFERFYRVDKARSRRVGGTGLGLAIVKHLVQAFGGRIEVASEPGKGSTFSVSLRLAEPRPSTTAAVEAVKSQL